MQKSSWSILWVAFSAGVIAAFVQFSIPPILPLLQAKYHISYTESALLMSLFALATLFSAVPGGFMVQRFGVRTIGLWGLGILFFFAPKIIARYPMDTYWISLMIVVAIGFLLFRKTIPRLTTEKNDLLPSKKVLISSELRNPNIWWVSVGFGTYTFTFFSFNTWITTVLVQTSSMPLASATFIPSLLALFAIASNVYAGFFYKEKEISVSTKPLFFSYAHP